MHLLGPQRGVSVKIVNMNNFSRMICYIQTDLLDID